MMRSRDRPDHKDPREKNRLSDDLAYTSWEEPGSYSLLTDETEETGLLAGADLDDEAGWEGPSENEVGVGVADFWSHENVAEWIDTEVGKPSDVDRVFGPPTDITGNVIGACPGLGTHSPLDTTEEGFEPEVEGAAYDVDREVEATARERET